MGIIENDAAVAKQQSATDFCHYHDEQNPCAFCYNHLEKLCLHEDWGGCEGSIRVVFSEASGMAMSMCDFHELDYYNRMDAIKAEYFNAREDDDY